MTRNRPSPARLVSLAKVAPFAAIAASALLAGCASPVAGGLGDDDANRVLVALERAGVDGTREPDPSAEGRFRVLVAREEASHAAAVLREEELPPRPSPGLLDSMGKGSLVPSGSVEHAQMIAGLSGELEKTLSGVDGVVSARVHVSIPPLDPLGERPQLRPSASVLLKHRGATPPIDALAVQRLVSGAVAGMKPDDVAVVLLPRPVQPAASARDLVRLGPIAVARGSVGYLRALIGGAIVLSALPTTALLALWLRGRKAARNEGT